MLKNYLKITFRNLKASKIYTFINISGLAVGLACFILILIFIINELNYDTFHEKAERIYRPVGIQTHPGVGEQHVAVTMGPLAPALKQDFPEVEHAVRLRPLRNLFCKYEGNGFYIDNVSFTDPEIFKVFNIPLIQGDSETALLEKNSVILSEEIASRLFGEENPIGKTIQTESWIGNVDFKVTGIMENYPQNSHIQFDILSTYSTMGDKFSWMKNWGTNCLATYVLLKEGTSAADLEAKFPEMMQKYRPENKSEDQTKFYLQPLNEIHLKSGHLRYQTFNNRQGSINTIYIFTGIAILILLIACINFMNLATARSAKRAREVGIRKVLGSNRKKLILQFIGESIILSFISLIIGYLLLEIAFPFFENLVDGRIISTLHHSPLFIFSIIGITLIIGVLAGSYPAFYLSAFKPISTLKGELAKGASGKYLRKTLVVLQFSIAMALIASTGIIMDQIDYIQNKDLGFNREHVLYFPVHSKQLKKKIPILKKELSRNQNIISVSATTGLSGAGGSQGTISVAGEEDKSLMLRFSSVYFDYINTMEMSIVQGRSFSHEIASDTVTSVIINETAVKELGWENPLGKEFSNGENKPNLKVVGVVKDYNYYTLHSQIEPLIMFIGLEQCNFVVMRIKPDDIKNTIANIEKVWNNHITDRPIEYSFLDEYFDQRYKGEINRGKLYAAFAIIAIMIGCLGLFGLASYMAEQKTKEIAIRKIFGASIPNVVLILINEFTKLVVISAAIGLPAAYFFIQSWLTNFVYHTSIHWSTFLISALIVLFIAITTVSFQAFKASVSNPVEALKYE